MIIGILEHALMITSFVFIMMLLIEYINVQTNGRWQETLKQSRWGQYLLCAGLGAIPGCLGAFTVVSLYSHRIVSFGALVATMIATSGDEAFVMFSMFPGKAAGLMAILLVTGIIAGFTVDVFYRKQDKLIEHLEHKMPMHESDSCQCFSKEQIWVQLKNITFPRVLLIIIFFSFIFFLLTGTIGPKLWDWKKITFAVGALFGLFIVTTVPDHFLEHHLWEHVLKKHLLRIFLWTFGALVLIHFIEGNLNLAEVVQKNYFMVLVIAVLVGIIPESGPHLLFVTLYSTGLLPFSILLASSIVQDGHGMLPLLAVSKRGFLWVKLINIIVGLAIGSIGLLLI